MRPAANVRLRQLGSAKASPASTNPPSVNMKQMQVLAMPLQQVIPQQCSCHRAQLFAAALMLACCCCMLYYSAVSADRRCCTSNVLALPAGQLNCSSTPTCMRVQ
jgi:hypothetical protein